jgi:uncharacterized protein (UPF0264 family)
MTESTEWQRIGDVPVDTGRLALVDPMNVDEVANYEADKEVGAIEPMTYELITNEHEIAVALILDTGLGDGSIRSKRVSRRPREPSGSLRYGSGSCRIR